MKLKITLAVSFVLINISINAQDANFSNSNASPIILNPSFAGSNGFIRSNLSYYNYYSGFTGAPSYVAVSNDFFLKPLNGAVALSYQGESIGPLDKRMFEVAYAQYFSSPDKQLTIVPSIQAGIGRRTISSDWIVGPQQTDLTSEYLNLNTGLLFNYRKNFYAGLNVLHVNKPVAAFPVHFIFHSSYSFRVSDNNVLQIMLRHDRNISASRTQISANTILWKYLIVGAGYYTWYEFNVILGARVNSFALQVGYNISEQRRIYSSNKIEMHLSYNLRKKEIRNEVPLFERM